jgi:hypothetical protein
METLIEQKVIITNEERLINNHIFDGWKVISIVAGTIATAPTQKSYVSNDYYDGKFCILLQRNKPVDE